MAGRRRSPSKSEVVSIVGREGDQGNGRFGVAAGHIEVSIARINDVAQSQALAGDGAGNFALVDELGLIVRALADIRNRLRELAAVGFRPA
jgi:hypothetical protein